MFDAEDLVPCLLRRVLPLIMNHADAETILEDPKVQFSVVVDVCLFSGWRITVFKTKFFKQTFVQKIFISWRRGCVVVSAPAALALVQIKTQNSELSEIL